MLRKVLIDWILMPACLIFTVITLALTGLATTITNFAPQFEALIALFIYSVVLAALNRILYFRSLHIGLRLVLHCTGIVCKFSCHFSARFIRFLTYKRSAYNIRCNRNPLFHCRCNSAYSKTRTGAQRK